MQPILVDTIRLSLASSLCQQGCPHSCRHNPFSCLSSSSTVGLIPLLVLLFSISLSFSISCPSSSLTVSYSLVLETCSCKFPPFLCSLPLSLHPSSVFIQFISNYLMVRCVFFLHMLVWECQCASHPSLHWIARHSVYVIGWGAKGIVWHTSAAWITVGTEAGLETGVWNQFLWSSVQQRCVFSCVTGYGG